ncbi:MAG: phosphate ABC transporter substrate-binding protein [Spirochaetaceae bacterium]|nr:MAG: phosphate ABC transporter substrate-binding protein [Spirochaetaceae bacterium]
MTFGIRFVVPILTAASLLVFTCSNSQTGSTRVQSASASGKTIQIIGSDTMVNLVQAWAEAFSPLHPSVNMSIRGGGSGTGLAALVNNSCDLAMSSRPISEKEITGAQQNNIEPKEWKVGLDGLVVIVHPQNPVSSLCLDQVRDIFLAKITDWKELGGDGGKIVILSRESNSGTYLFFKEHVLRRGDKKNTDEFSPDALLMPSSQAIVNEVSQNPHAIGYVGLGYISPKLKALSIAKNTTSMAIQPSIKHVADDSYPISRPLFFYTNGNPQTEIKEFLDFALSTEGQAIVVKTDFVPVK